MNRTECYSFIKKNGLSEWIKSESGKNYTNMPTTALLNFIAVWESRNSIPEISDEDIYDIDKSELEIEIEEEKPVDALTVVGRLVQVLKNKRILIGSEIKYILG